MSKRVFMTPTQFDANGKKVGGGQEIEPVVHNEQAAAVYLTPGGEVVEIERTPVARNNESADAEGFMPVAPYYAGHSIKDGEWVQNDTPEERAAAPFAQTPTSTSDVSGKLESAQRDALVAEWNELNQTLPNLTDAAYSNGKNRLFEIEEALRKDRNARHAEYETAERHGQRRGQEPLGGPAAGHPPVGNSKKKDLFAQCDALANGRLSAARRMVTQSKVCCSGDHLCPKCSKAKKTAAA
jgi:hypothetical protein